MSVKQPHVSTLEGLLALKEEPPKCFKCCEVRYHLRFGPGQSESMSIKLYPDGTFDGKWQELDMDACGGSGDMETYSGVYFAPPAQGPITAFYFSEDEKGHTKPLGEELEVDDDGQPRFKGQKSENQSSHELPKSA